MYKSVASVLGMALPPALCLSWFPQFFVLKRKERGQDKWKHREQRKDKYF